MFTARCLFGFNACKKYCLSQIWRPELQKRMSSSHHRVAAVCQLTATPDKESNFSACQELMEQASLQGARMVFLPEGFDYIGSSREETLALSESLSGKTVSRYSQMAKKLEIWLSLGGFHERGHDWDSDRRIYNSHIIMNDKGEVVSVYRKAHLFDVELPEKGVLLKESAFTIPGPSLMPPVQTPIGKVGLGICYDIRFPELSCALQRKGAEILTFPSAFTVATGAAHWEVLLRARAIETQCFVLAAAQVGAHHEKRSSHGHAMAVDPWGEVIADCGGEKPGLRLVEIDLEKLHNTRRNMPTQLHRRDLDFYTGLE
ncbi:deaminated glutathione amidase isoform X1 [Synchiropus splendidus]|uniref:deaminated glutathione amidase isoform X1 n=2 Tax=Synchiropus splendidus TaxID=270530 RepID=UPI00237E6255|nr:deaminated glutathione amidase isoform X1 [Synchiropus splendidus]